MVLIWRMGLRTSYKDFIDDYLDKKIDNINSRNRQQIAASSVQYEDDDIKMITSSSKRLAINLEYGMKI